LNHIPAPALNLTIIIHMISHPFLLIPPCLAAGIGHKNRFLPSSFSSMVRTHVVSQSPLTCSPCLAPWACAPEPLFAVRNGFRRRLYAHVVFQLLLVGPSSTTVRDWTEESLLELGLLRLLSLNRLFVLSRVFILSRYIYKYIWLDFHS